MIKYFVIIYALLANLAFANKDVIDTANWLSQLPDDKTINQLIMPGSHDAGMYQTRHCTFIVAPQWAQAQNLSMYQQLTAGSRYFDLRVDYDHKKLTTYHRTDSIGCGGAYLEDILNQSVQFLIDHPSEFIILKFSHTRSDSGHNPEKTTNQVINLLKDKYKSFLYVNESQNINLAKLSLGQVRGKIITVFDNEYNHDHLINSLKGTFSYHDYSNENP